MRLAIITPDGLSTVLYARSFASVLARRAADQLITISSIDGYDKEIGSLGSQHHSLQMARFIDPGRDLAYMAELYRLLRTIRPDAVLTYTHKPNIYGTLVAWLAGVPVRIAAVRGLGSIFQRRASRKRALIYQIMLFLYRLAGRAATGIWFTNPNDKAWFIELGIAKEGRTLQTSNAITLSEYSPDVVPSEKIKALRNELGLTEADVVVLMVGRLIQAKGVIQFMDSATAVRKTFPRAKFLLVAPPEEGAVDEVSVVEVKEREQQGDFQWLGFRRDLRDLYAVIDLAVLPSWYQEGGYPRALLEPMAFAKPVIAADTESCRNPVEPGINGFLVPPGDTQSLADAICRLVASPDLRKKMGQRSREKILEEFDDLTVATTIADYIANAHNKLSDVC